jgi:ketosteroid isomerase-like protein
VRDTARAMSQENMEVVRRIWGAAERGDDEAVFALYDPDIVWESHHVGPMERGGVHHGHKGIRHFFRDWLESFGSYEAHAETFTDAGDRVVVRYRVSGCGRGSGAEVEMTRWNVYEFANGLVTRVEIFCTEPDAREAAGISE